jgi:hypothetical protein
MATHTLTSCFSVCFLSVSASQTAPMLPFTILAAQLWYWYPPGHCNWRGAASEPAMHLPVDAHQPQSSLARQSSHVA